MRREGNTASEVLHRAWDGDILETLTKNSAERATGAHLSIIGHTTKSDLRRHLAENEIMNGFANRFILVSARRSKCLPEGGQIPEDALKALAARVRDAQAFAEQASEIKRDPDASVLWRELYPSLSEGRPGLLGSATSRAEAQVLRLSMLYALLDSSCTIRQEHLLAAVAIWDFALASARNVFGDSVGDLAADTILAALRRSREGMTQSEIHALFGRNRQEVDWTAAARCGRRLSPKSGSRTRGYVPPGLPTRYDALARNSPCAIV
jgi:hypothetical protein